ncbi:MAG TPA: energy transducer TonB [Novosphingobium sp.]|nr:energy transducer TonB [Novosphingobium sp.]
MLSPARRAAIFLAAMAAAAWPALALAQGFDLDCRQVPTEAGLTYGPRKMHLQIDRAAGKWCADRCDTVEKLAAADGDRLTLLDGLTKLGDPVYRMVDLSTAAMVDVFGVGKPWERKVHFICTPDTFGGFAPYLAADPEPIGNIGTKILAGGPPRGADGKMLEGRVAFRIEVDAAGQPTACAITAASGTPALDERICPLVMPGLRFRPARDRAGKAVPGRYESRVRWINPD